MSDPTHRIVFHYTPKHASWMNQVEIWLSTLVRKVIKRGNFASITELRRKVLAFIAYYNRSMAKPFQWTHQGKAFAPLHSTPVGIIRAGGALSGEAVSK